MHKPNPNSEGYSVVVLRILAMLMFCTYSELLGAVKPTPPNARAFLLIAMAFYAVGETLLWYRNRYGEGPGQSFRHWLSARRQLHTDEQPDALEQYTERRLYLVRDVPERTAESSE